MATGRNEDLKAVELCFTVENIQNVKTFHSSIVYIRGLPWMISLLKITKKNGTGNDVASLFMGLNLKAEEIECQGAVIAKASIKMIPFITNQMPHQMEIGPCAFDSKFQRWGTTLAMTWDELMNTGMGYVSNNSCTFEAKIEVGPYQDDILSDFIQMETIKKCCDGGPEKTFRMTVKKFHQFIGVCSPKFLLHGVPWRISISKLQNRVVRYTDRVTYSLCIDLSYLNDVLMKWPYQIDLHIRLMSFDPKIAPTKLVIKGKRNRSADALMLWDDFINPAKRLIENDSFVVEIDMKVERIKVNELKRKNSDRRSVELECPICMENLVDRPISVTKCGHLFCKVCVAALKICPCCIQEIKAGDLRPIYLPAK